MKQQAILILDFGSQYNQLIARRIREMGFYAEVIPYHNSLDEILSRRPKGILLSGGPSSVHEDGAHLISKEFFELDIPVLGICYGMQLISHIFGGLVTKGKHGEYGQTDFIVDDPHDRLLRGIPEKSTVWMSHFDEVNKEPEGFKIVGHTIHCAAALSCEDRNIYAVQFHPEVSQTTYGTTLLHNFVFDICCCEKNWELGDFIKETTQEIRRSVGDKKVILGLSGGVDSSVAAVLIHKAIGNALTCIFVDTGLLRKDEAKKVMDTYAAHYHMDIRLVKAKERFLSRLKGVSDPEEKRKIIGREFIAVFQKEASKIPETTFLAQGTIYPDVIESTSVKGPSATIKSHHNVGGLPEQMHLKLLEPLRELFKDETRKVGINLGIPKEMVYRHPFPGPGLGIRILGEITEKKVAILQAADAIFIEELQAHQLYDQVSQAFVVLLPVNSVGVMGDVRTYEYTAVLRSVNTTDFMTATWSHLPYDFLGKVSNRIINEVKGINRVTYDISSKPPATIEWE
ncbi:MAG: glutamine-hydrolyzing GMP synthase [Flavobacteriales bacterium AspAUS03]